MATQPAEIYEKILIANLQRAIDFVKFAEAKNAALLALSSAWVLTTVAFDSGQKTIPAHFGVSMKVALVMTLAAALLAMYSFLPRLHLPKFLGGKRAGPHPKNLLYFGDIRTLPVRTFEEDLRKRYMPEAGKSHREEYLHDLAVQIHINSDIAVFKMRLFRVGLSFIAIAGFALLASAVYSFF